MKANHDYLKEKNRLEHNLSYDFCISSNLDERYNNIFSNLTKKEIIKLAQKYPTYKNKEVEKLIKSKFKLKNIVLGAGSEDLIVRCNKIIEKNRWSVGIVLPAFYRIIDTISRWIALREEDLLKNKIKSFSAIWLCNSNPLTGRIIEKGKLLKIFNDNPRKLFFLDETSIFFLENWKNFSFLGKNLFHDNLVLISSFSKFFGISGLRAGFATGNKNFIENLKKEANTFPFTSITEYFVKKIIKKEKLFDQIRQNIHKNKNHVEKILSLSQNIEIIPSVTNCVFFRHKKKRNFYKILLKEKIFCLNLDTQKGTLPKGVIRLTIHSSRKLTNILISKLKKVLKYET